MSDIAFDIDTSNVTRMLKEFSLTSSESKKVIRQTINSALGKMRGAVQRELGATGVHNARSLKRFVRTTVYKRTHGGNVNIMDDRSAKGARKYKKAGVANRSYLLKWINSQERDRYTRGAGGNRPLFRGHMGSTHFFANGINKVEAAALKVIEDDIRKYIDRIVARRR